MSIPEPGKPSVSPRKSSDKKIRVLIAEDNAVNQLIISKVIKDHGFEGTLVSDGKQAIQKLQSQVFRHCAHGHSNA